MYVKLFFLICFLALAANSHAQQITLEVCLAKSHTNYPLQDVFEVIQQSSELKIQRLRTKYLPQMDLIGQISWQNDVPHFNSPSPGFNVPKAPKDQYKAYVDMRQMIYDGGITKASKELESRAGLVDVKAVEVELYGVRTSVIDSYFMILMLEQQMKQLDLAIERYQTRIDELAVALKNGALLQSDVNSFRIEKLKIEQSRVGLTEARVTALKILEELVGEPLNTQKGLVVPSEPEVSDSLVMRPEMAHFNAQQKLLEASMALAQKNRMPQFFGFGQMGYGNPGYNMLRDEFAEFYMFGLRLNWRIFDWQESARQKAILAKQKELVQTRQQTFLKQLQIALEKVAGDIRKLEHLVNTDNEILNLQRSVTAVGLSKYQNGSITSAEYINDLNAELMAALALDIHKLELAKKKTEYKNLLGY
jgi:outer membrane protein TolC